MSRSTQQRTTIPQVLISMPVFAPTDPKSTLLLDQLVTLPISSLSILGGPLFPQRISAAQNQEIWLLRRHSQHPPLFQFQANASTSPTSYPIPPNTVPFSSSYGTPMSSSKRLAGRASTPQRRPRISSAIASTPTTLETTTVSSWSLSNRTRTQLYPKVAPSVPYH